MPSTRRSSRSALVLAALLPLAMGACSDDDPLAPLSPEDVEYAPELGVVIEEMTLLPSGVYIETLQEGSLDAIPVSTGRVEVDYTLWLPDGTQVDSSRDPGRVPLFFNFGQSDVIPGFEIGVSGMRVGELRRIIVPSELAYGERGSGLIPPNSVLVFEVELLSASDSPTS
ncbi:MAG: FKBP-type peptidyl-prolyl cis-trans isomerase [Gemmatimonadota bacterium]